jgi:SAM-dependent methyltransferase
MACGSSYCTVSLLHITRKVVRTVLAGVLCGSFAAQASDVHYVPTPMNVVDAILELGGVGAGDFLVDLGSGDGRISIQAAKRFGTRGFGVEIESHLARMANDAAQKQGVADKVNFEVRDLFNTDLSRASVVTAYLLPALNLRLRPQLFEQLRPGSRIVTHDFDFGDWKPDARITVNVPDKPYGPPRSEIMLWVIPADFSGTWSWRLPVEGVEQMHEAVIGQKYQQAAGKGRIAGGAAALGRLEIRGDAISFVMGGEPAGKAALREFRGRINGDTITGSAMMIVEGGSTAGHAASVPWQAVRTQRGRMNIGEPQFGSGSSNKEQK